MPRIFMAEKIGYPVDQATDEMANHRHKQSCVASSMDEKLVV